MGLAGLNPGIGSTGLSGWYRVSPTMASLIFFMLAITYPTWPAYLGTGEYN